MRYWLLTLSCLLFCAIPSHATNPAFVESDGIFTQATAATATQTNSLTHTSTAGNDIVLGIAWENKTRSVKTVTATNAVFLPYVGETPGSGNDMVSIWVCHKCASISSVVVTLTGGSKWVAAYEEYSGVTAYGQATSAIATNTHPTTVTTTQDANNIVVSMSSSLGSGGVPTAGTGCGTTSGTLRDANRTGTTATDSAGGFCDQGAASAQTSVSIANTITSVSWSALALELRSAKSPMTDHVESYGANNSVDANNTQQDFIVPLSNDLTLTGNTAVCWASWPGGTTAPTVTDLNNAYGALGDTVTKDKEVDDASNIDVAIWHIPTTAGAHFAKFHFGSALATNAQFSSNCSNFYNISGIDAGATPTCGATTVTTGPNLSCGAMATSAADVIFVVAAFDGKGPNTGPFMGPCREGNGYTLLIPANLTGYCSEYTVTAGSGTPNPAIYFSEFASDAGGQTTNQYTIVGVAYTISAGGTAPSGLYVVRQWQPTTAGVHKFYLNCPSTGNFTAGVSTAGAAFTITDGNQVTWTNNSPSAVTNQGYLSYSTNSSLDASSMCQYANTDTGSNDEETTYDVSGVATSSPIATPAACSSPSTLVNSGTNVNCANATFTGTTTQTDAPDITPASSGDLIIVAAGWGTGPSIGFSQPSAALYDCGTYTTQTDSSGMCLGEGHGHLYTTSTSALNFGYTMGTGASGAGAGVAYEIKKAPAAAVTTHAPPMISMLQ